MYNMLLKSMLFHRSAENFLFILYEIVEDIPHFKFIVQRELEMTCWHVTWGPIICFNYRRLSIAHQRGYFCSIDVELGFWFKSMTLCSCSQGAWYWGAKTKDTVLLFSERLAETFLILCLIIIVCKWSHSFCLLLVYHVGGPGKVSNKSFWSKAFESCP